jgi:hypothetical protein
VRVIVFRRKGMTTIGILKFSALYFSTNSRNIKSGDFSGLNRVGTEE